VFDSVQNLTKALLEIVSSANIVGCGKVLLEEGYVCIL
jgi:hypothetical protein